MLLVAAAALLIVGFANAADYGFDEPSAYGVIAAGGVMFGLAVVNMLYTKRNAIIPAVGVAVASAFRQADASQRMFKIRTTLFFLLAS